MRARERVAYTKTLLDEIGLGSGRLEMFHIGASEAPMFAETVEMMTDRAKELGPNPLRQKAERERTANLGVG
jgi:F420-non-reducing hydrogenase iron-sulfur subunit